MSEAVWVVVEHDGRTPRRVSLELLGRTRALGFEYAAVVLGTDP